MIALAVPNQAPETFTPTQLPPSESLEKVLFANLLALHSITLVLTLGKPRAQKTHILASLPANRNRRLTVLLLSSSRISGVQND